MNFKTVKNVVTSKAGRSLLRVQKNSPALLFAVGVAGMIGTVVLASRATLKLEESLESINQDREIAKEMHESPNDATIYTDKEYQRDMVLLYIRSVVKVGRLYAPAIACGAVSIAALTGSHYILNSRNVALTAAYAAVDKAYKQYQDRVAAEFGPEKARELRSSFETEEVLERKADGTVATTTKKLAGVKGLSAYAVIFDEHSQNWSKEERYNQIFLQCQQNYANDLLRARGHVLLNDVYDMLGLPRTKAGCVVGWVAGKGDDFVDFGVFRNDTFMGQQFVNGDERSVVLDFNVAGVVYDLIEG